MTLCSFRLPRHLSVAAVLVLLLPVTTPALRAASIHGMVINLTRNKPSAGDTVALIRLQQGMQVGAQTTTDAEGNFTLPVNDADPMHLVRVTHQGANYFQPAPPGRDTVDVQVYDAAAQVEGISTEADVLRVEADGKELRVTENFFVKNTSSPPRTRIGDHTFPIYLPKDAEIASSAALGPGSMPVQSSPQPTGAPGEYAFAFPLRPGETRFQISYRLPYTGSFQFEPRVAGPVDNFALILPKSIHFTADAAGVFQPINDDVNVQTYLARGVKPGAKLRFRISGTGQLPQESAQQSGNAQQNGAASPESANATAPAAEANNRPGGGLGVPIDTPDPLNKYKWWILSLAVVLLAVGAGVSFQRTKPVTAATPTGANLSGLSTTMAPGGVGAQSTVAPDGPTQLLNVLKEELFALESERLQGDISAEDYERQKAALEIVLKRALERSSTGGAPLA